MGSWLDALEPAAPDLVAAFRGIEAERFISVRREVRRRAGAGSTAGLVTQLEALASALIDEVERLPEEAFRAPGGEEDWTVAQAIGHDASARAGLVLAASLAASGRWPADAPTVVPAAARRRTSRRTDRNAPAPMPRYAATGSGAVAARSSSQVIGGPTP